jgi:hypothetical protein
MSKVSLQVIFSSPCEIAYLGNSITVQKNSFHDYLHALLAVQKNISALIKAGIGGVGSLACNFMANQLVLDRNAQIYFVEHFAGDMGGATPMESIGGAVKGLVHKLLNQDIFVIYIYLFRSSTAHNTQATLPICEDIASRYKILAINVYDYIHDQWCEMPPIQAAYFKKPLTPSKRITIAMRSDVAARYGANGQVNTFVHTGDALKIFGFLEYQPHILKSLVKKWP